MRWVTRSNIHVDRAASAWLIKSFIDPAAEFVYVDDPSDAPSDAHSFDMRGATYGHVGADITFETLLRHFELDDPVLWQLAEMVHEADLGDERYDAPEGHGLDLIVRAISEAHDDESTRELVAVILASLYDLLRSRLLAG